MYVQVLPQLKFLKENRSMTALWFKQDNVVIHSVAHHGDCGYVQQPAWDTERLHDIVNLKHDKSSRDLGVCSRVMFFEQLLTANSTWPYSYIRLIPEFWHPSIRNDTPTWMDLCPSFSSMPIWTGMVQHVPPHLWACCSPHCNPWSIATWDFPAVKNMASPNSAPSARVMAAGASDGDFHYEFAFVCVNFIEFWKEILYSTTVINELN